VVKGGVPLGCTCVALFPPRKGRLLQTIMNHQMNSIVTNLGAAALVGLILVLPFVILEALNNTFTRQNAPGLAVLFGLLWVLPIAFIVILMPIVRTARAGTSVLANPLSLLLRVAFLTLIVMTWTGTVNDQLPCFLGVLNCD
jgi:hypothetical protein